VREPFVAYIRVSTYYEDKISPDIQRTAIKAWAERNSAEIVHWVPDLDVSGRLTKRRITECLRWVEERKARGIAVWRFSRFGRSRRGNALNLAMLEQLGGRLASATEAADTRDPFGRLQQGIALKFAEYESDMIGKAWAETRENRLGRGLPATGGQRWGYVWQRRRLDEDGTLHPEAYVPDEELGLVVTDIYERLADGERMASICRWLGRQGYTNTRGKPWDQKGLTRYLDKGFPAGWLLSHPQDCDCPPHDPDKATARANLCKNRLWIPGDHESIVKEDVWEAYKKQRAGARSAPRKTEATYALSWLVPCARCGKTCSISGSSTYGAGKVLIRKPGYAFRCQTRTDSGTCAGVNLRREVAEAAVLKHLTEWADEIEARAAAIPQQQSDDTPRSESAAARVERLTAELRAQLADLEQQLDRQTSLLARDIIPEDSYLRERDRLTKQRDKITAELAEVEQAAEETAPQEVDRVALVPVMRGLVERWEITPVETRRRLLKQVLHGVWAYPKETLPDGTVRPAYAVPVPVWEEKPEPIGQLEA
jgi:DNA invertase Pin-like site-specific DNA recombinase